MTFTCPAACPSDIFTELSEFPVTLRNPVTSYQARGTVGLDLRDGVEWRGYRDDDQGSAFERHRGRVPFDMDKHNTMEKACRHLIDFMRIKEQVEKFGLGAFD